MASTTPATAFGSADLRLPDELRGPLLAHLADLHQKYLARNWAGRVGFGHRPALIVTGVSTSHCVYATCRDATDSFRVIVAR